MNATCFLKTGGHYVLYVKASCIESTDLGTNQGLNLGDALFSSLIKRKQVQCKRLEQVTLEPFNRGHAYVSGVFRTLQVSVRIMPHFAKLDLVAPYTPRINLNLLHYFQGQTLHQVPKRWLKLQIFIVIAILPFKTRYSVNLLTTLMGLREGGVLLRIDRHQQLKLLLFFRVQFY